MNIPKDPSDSRNWMSAQDFCVKEDGTLVSIENEIEQGEYSIFKWKNTKHFHSSSHEILSQIIKVPIHYF